MITRRVFISSTVYDLRKEREAIRKLLHGFNAPSGMLLECVMSDYPDFRVPPRSLAEKHSFEICLENLRACDYVIVVLNKRYGSPVIDHQGQFISITHREYREAFDYHLPTLTFVNNATWNAKNASVQGRHQSYISPKHTRIFDLIEEIRLQTHNNWIEFYRDIAHLETRISSSILNFDHSLFEGGDITVPDGAIVRSGRTFTKTWEIENQGMVVWENRRICEINEGTSGLIPDKISVPIPRTMPGEKVRISVTFTAPRQAATCESVWKMFDENGRLCFPHFKGIWCRVKVIA